MNTTKKYCNKIKREIRSNITMSMLKCNNYTNTFVVLWIFHSLSNMLSNKNSITNISMNTNILEFNGLNHLLPLKTDLKLLNQFLFGFFEKQNYYSLNWRANIFIWQVRKI